MGVLGKPPWKKKDYLKHCKSVKYFHSAFKKKWLRLIIERENKAAYS